MKLNKRLKNTKPILNNQQPKLIYVNKDKKVVRNMSCQKCNMIDWKYYEY